MVPLRRLRMTGMTWRMTAEGKTGIANNTSYDAWTPARAYMHYHGGIRILTETASAQIASPITVSFDSLRPGYNVDPKVAGVDYLSLWPGGRWGIGAALGGSSRRRLDLVLLVVGLLLGRHQRHPRLVLRVPGRHAQPPDQLPLGHELDDRALDELLAVARAAPGHQHELQPQRGDGLELVVGREQERRAASAARSYSDDLTQAA